MYAKKDLSKSVVGIIQDIGQNVRFVDDLIGIGGIKGGYLKTLQSALNVASLLSIDVS